MRIEHIHVEAFGRLAQFDSGTTPLGPLVVVLGPNEAGKSTLFNFLTTALYGFHPASRERNPHVPWGAEEASGRIAVRLERSRCVTVERRLRSSPSGRIESGQDGEELRNQPVPWVTHVPRAVFGQVFAITLADLAGLDEDTWAGIQDRVLGSMGASDLRSARDVADALEKEAGEIWRPNRRGNQRLRDVQDEARALRRRRNDALERDRRIRALIEEREEVELRLRDVRADRQRDRIVVERIQELLPVKRRLDHLAALRAEGGPRAELDGLPADLRHALGELAERSARLEESLDDLDRAIDDAGARMARFDDGARLLLERRDAVVDFVTSVRATEPDRGRLPALRRDLEGMQVKVRSAADALLSRPFDDAAEAALSALSVDLLDDRIARLAEARKRRMARDRAAPPRSAVPPVAAAVIAGALGAGLLAWGLSGGPVAATVAGAALIAASLALALSRRGTRAIDMDLDAPDDVTVLTGEVERMLAPLPVRAEFMDPPGAPLVSAVRRLRGFAVERAEITRTIRVVGERLERLDDDAQSLAAGLSRSAPGAAHELAARLERELRDAEHARDEAEVTRREHERLTDRRHDVAEELGRCEAAVHELHARVEELAAARGGDPANDGGAARIGDPIDGVQRRLTAHARADRLDDELTQSHPDLDELRARIRSSDDEGASWLIDESELAVRKARIESLDQQVEELIARAKTLERDAEHLRELETVDAVDSEIASLEEVEARLVRVRDRKWVLSQLVREADRRFREEHQPDLLRRASGYLQRLTGGRYDRLLVVEEGGGDLFQLVGPGLPAPVPLARPVSTGTLEQAYLSLRLAIVDHLDQGEEKLPLFLDEAFVNWDAGRRDRGLEVIAEVSASRQVFAFTCHPEMAERLRAHGACQLRLRL